MKKWILIGGVGYLLSQTLSVYIERCENGDGKQCMKAGRVFLEGRKGESKDAEKALLFFEKGCDAKKPNGLSCSMAGYMNYTGEENTDINTSRGIHYYNLACIEGENKSCAKVREYYKRTNINTPADRQTAKDILTTECLSGTGLGCLSLGNFLTKNISTRNFTTREEIAVAYTRGCKRGSKESCEKAIEILGKDLKRMSLKK